jgi:hypothetical protein
MRQASLIGVLTVRKRFSLPSQSRWTDSTRKIFTKESLLSDFKSGKHKLLSFETGPMNVQVLGDVAVVQASVTEKRLDDGKDISGQFVFMDLLKNRSGKWVVVRTLGARVS